MSGINGEVPGKGKNFPGIPRTNSVPSPLVRGLPQGVPQVILDSVAKRSQEDYVNFQKACPGGFITGSCENGHRFAKEVYCGREWCVTCNGKWVKGEDMKPSHARRFARWYEKAQQIESMGYWTFTIPEELRSKYRTKKALTELGHQVQELLKSYGYSRGLRRWHWFGDRSEKYHPHLNCLVDGGLLGGKALRAIRRAYSKLLGVKLAIADYHYLTSPGEKVHALRYVTRATFLDARWDVRMALELRGFRNQLWWGSKRWGGPAVWSLDDLPEKPAAGSSDVDMRAVAALEQGYCPHDGLKIVWERYEPNSHFWGIEVVSIGAGYGEFWLDGVPPYWRDGNEYERKCYWRACLDKALALSGLPPPCKEGLNEAFLARHKSFVRAKVSRLAQAEADRGLLAEVDERVKSSFQSYGEPGDSGGGDKTHYQPNCLVPPSVIGEIRPSGAGVS